MKEGSQAILIHLPAQIRSAFYSLVVPFRNRYYRTCVHSHHCLSFNGCTQQNRVRCWWHWCFHEKNFQVCLTAIAASSLLLHPRYCVGSFVRSRSLKERSILEVPTATLSISDSASSQSQSLPRSSSSGGLWIHIVETFSQAASRSKLVASSW